MKVIIAGSRDIIKYGIVEEAVESSGFNISTVIHGDAIGIDRLGGNWGKVNGKKVERYPADWTKGKHAGFLRNAEMGAIGDALLAIWNGHSHGTRHMIGVALDKKIPVCVYQPAEVKFQKWKELEKISKDSTTPLLWPDPVSVMTLDSHAEETKVWRGDRVCKLKDSTLHLHGALARKMNTTTVRFLKGTITSEDVQIVNVIVKKGETILTETCYMVREDFDGASRCLVSSMGESYGLPKMYRTKLKRWLNNLHQ